MELTEIILLCAGGIIFILSFFIPAGKGKGRGQSAAPMAREEIKGMVGQEIEASRGRMDDAVQEAVSHAVEKAERSLERLSNEKIMAINEYSDTVLAEIHKNHEEAVFLYDMLNSKHTNLKNTVQEVNRTVQAAKEQADSLREPSFAKQQPKPDPGPEAATGLARAAARASGESAPKAAFVRLAEEQIAKELGTQKPQETPEPDKAAENNYNQQILKLYSQGRDRVQIARELGLGVGEVNLVLDLFDEDA